MIILLYGDDTFRSRQHLKILKTGFKNKYDPRGLNIIQLEGSDLNQEDFNKAVATYGFLSSRRLIIIDNLSRNKNKVLIDTVQNTLSELPEKENVVILWEDKNKSVRGRKTSDPVFGLKAGKGVIIYYYPLLKRPKLNQWVKNEITKRGSKIELKALALLLSLVGDDLWRMTSEIDKLVSYKQGSVIDEDDVALLVRAKFDTDIFKLTDALATRDTVTALRLLDDQISSGVALPYILTMLIRQFRILLQTRDYLDAGNQPSRLASELGLHPFVANKAVLQSKYFTIKQLKKIYRGLLRLDEKLKSSGFNQRVFFDLFAIEATT